MPGHTQLFQIEECPDLYVDACVCDEQRNLIFLSAWGRDTAMQEFLARLTLGTAEDGLDQFHIVMNGQHIPVFPDVELLDKRTTRQLRGTLFGSLLHLWLFDQRCAQPDRANHFAYALIDEAQDPFKRLWPLVVNTCPLPFLPHWREPVMSVLTAHNMLQPLVGAIGPVTAWRLSLQLDVLEKALGELIREGKLTTEVTA
ncbi:MULTISPECIES: hypothetical protein [Pseudomonas syringae group]|uniref:Uncharacterized protein n=1 Tax=Pseudomonas syringae pv. tomato TaxID=323 RepID=A0AAQ0NFB0_PSEUB|nr:MULTISPECIES: hypothetical protein [Pseudomonas syringae group]AVI83900.1 hypothetical protein XJ28_09345 [Pseudomonas syringae pv. tomato]EEB56837.1 hypothetical protein PSPTOT1_4085 [Pseudomonas syringae pv. tomato T1]EPN50164.1 hypothetical protein A241_18713 [Pseudomonas syringae pv. actinidiae ICMP 19094]KGK92317.1 hypothetical protein NB04_27365 [Pseudomonas syringae pv. tomato]KUR38960.1 hypothetical protein PSTA9_05356 [Pseudomonas syringae pv. tomato]